MKLWLEKNDIEMYSTHNEGKCVVAEKFIRTIKNKIYKYTTSISKNVYIDKLDDIVDEYNNTYHRTIKMKPIDVKDDLNTDFNTKVSEIEGKIPIITGLSTNSELIAVENRIPNVSSLVKKTDNNTKISDIEKKITDHNRDKYITTPEFNTMAASTFNARLAAQTD